MSDPTQPKGPPAAPAEGPTKAFVLKMDTWLKDFDLEAAAPAAPDVPLFELVAPVVPPTPDKHAVEHPEVDGDPLGQPPPEPQPPPGKPGGRPPRP